MNPPHAPTPVDRSSPEQLWPLEPPSRPPIDQPLGWYDVPADRSYPPSAPSWSEQGVHAWPTTAPPMRSRRPRWGCGDIAYGILIALGLGFVFAIPLLLAGVAQDSLAFQAFGAMSVWLGLGGWALFCSWVKGLGSLKLDFAWAFKWYDIFIGLGLTIVMFMVGIVLSMIQQAVGVKAATNTQFLQEQQSDGAGWTYFALILMVAIGAPVVEELFFRGLAYSAFAKRFGTVVAVLGSSAIFGFLHFQPGELVPTLFLLVNLTAFGLLLGLSRWYFKRTGPAVFSHMFFNLTAALVILAGWQ